MAHRPVLQCTQTHTLHKAGTEVRSSLPSLVGAEPVLVMFALSLTALHPHPLSLTLLRSARVSDCAQAWSN